jgi:histidine decarboxylase
MGYPCNAAFQLAQFFDWWHQSSSSQAPLNDVGGPETETLYNLNARPFERRLLQFFAELFSIEPYWGYTTSGGTQGNEQGLYIGRQALEKYGKPILYFSEEAHYSIASLGKVLGLDRCVIATAPHGEIDYEDLAKRLNPTRPALFSLSMGTTFKGAIDDIDRIQRMVKAKHIKHVYYHVDAALFGGYLPFYPDSHKPDLNFQKHPYDSIAISGHKFFGSPVPMGVFFCRREHIQTLQTDYIDYIDAHNLTIPCSRSALNSLIFWWIVSTTSTQEFAQQAVNILENAKYLYQKLKQRHYPVGLNPYSNTVYFKQPSDALCKAWCLSVMHCHHLGDLAHAVVMQHVDKEMIDQFLQELDRETN